jgi:ATP-dependent helicase HrpA/adenine-specific DNA-methyltransferase
MENPPPDPSTKNPVPGEGGLHTPRYGLYRSRSKTAREFARHLRSESTDAEKRLWRLLRERRFSGFKFRRQHPVAGYFLDFYCVAARLAVELDGGGHGHPDQRSLDETRSRVLAAQGIRVLRFWNHQLDTALETVRFEIWYALMQRTGRSEEISGYLPAQTPPT